MTSHAQLQQVYNDGSRAGAPILKYSKLVTFEAVNVQNYDEPVETSSSESSHDSVIDPFLLAGSR